MNKTTIFVEGDNDELFLRQLIEEWYKVKLGKQGEIGGIIILGGHNEQYKKATTFQTSIDQGYKNIVFEDADLIKDNRGFTNVCKLLEDQKQKYAMNFDYFLFPNNQDEGSLEDLLMNIAQQPKNEWVKCANMYFACLANNGLKIDKHSQWDFITGSLLKDKRLNFSNTTTWSIKDNSYLQQLRTFLDKFFVKI
jgi:hypothetical protein